MALLVAVSLAGPASARRRRRSPQVDHLELATVLVRDGAYARAVGVLAQVDPEAKGVDRPRFFLLRGLAQLNLSLFRQAAADLRASIQAGQADPIAKVYLAQAYFYADQPQRALDALAQARDRADQLPSTFALAAEALRKLGRPEAAWGRLSEGQLRHPGALELLRRKVYFAVDRGLSRTAVELGRRYLRRAAAAPEDYLALGQALMGSGGEAEALSLLETARLRYPQAPKVNIALARAYKARGSLLSAAELLERAAVRLGQDALLVEAAELFKQAGRPYRALALNGRIVDREQRLRQRLSVLLELRQYELVAAMAGPLARVGLLKDERVRYAVAYALFKARRWRQAEGLLSGLSDPELFRQAAQLRRAMADCRLEAWRC